MHWNVQGLNSGTDKIRFSSKIRPTALGPTESPISWLKRFIPKNYERDVKLTTNLHLVPRLRMGGALALLTLYDHGVQRVKLWISWPLKMGSICCTGTSVRLYHYKLRNDLEERRSRGQTNSLLEFCICCYITLSPMVGLRAENYKLIRRGKGAYWETLQQASFPYLQRSPVITTSVYATPRL
jgi:hypothetical protein